MNFLLMSTAGSVSNHLESEICFGLKYPPPPRKKQKTKKNTHGQKPDQSNYLLMSNKSFDIWVESCKERDEIVCNVQSSFCPDPPY